MARIPCIVVFLLMGCQSLDRLDHALEPVGSPRLIELVWPDGSPAAGLPVQLRSVSGDWGHNPRSSKFDPPLFIAVTGSNGLCTVQGYVVEDQHYIYCEHAHYTAAGFAQEDGATTLTLRPNVFVHVEIVDSEGLPVSGEYVALNVGQSFRAYPGAVSDARGCVIFEVTAAHSEGYGRNGLSVDIGKFLRNYSLNTSWNEDGMYSRVIVSREYLKNYKAAE